MRRTFARVAAAFCLLVLSSGPLVLSQRLAAAGTAPITGIGSSFAALEMNQWQADTARRPYNLSVNYIVQGSSVGRGQFASGQVDFGASDIVYVPNDWGNGSLAGLLGPRCHGAPIPNCFRYVPVSAGGLSFMYNVVDNAGNRVTNLQLTRRQACQIFTGEVTDWGQLLGGSFSGRPIKVLTRADGAGESYVLSQFCIAVDPGDWQAFINQVQHQQASAQNVGQDFLSGQPTSLWPYGVADLQSPVSGGDGIANSVQSADAGKDSIGYDAAGYAKVRGLPVASVQNAAGVFTPPDETNVTVALAYAFPNTDPNQLGTFHLRFDGPDPRSYFPSTYSYVLAQTGGFDGNKGSTLAQFLCYAVGQGQVIAPSLRYARLSAPIVQISVDAINNIPTSPPSQCVPTGPPPPPAAQVLPFGAGGSTTTTLGPNGSNSTNGSSGPGSGANGSSVAGAAGATGAAGANGGTNGGNGNGAGATNGANGRESGSSGTGSNENGGSGGAGGCESATQSSTSTTSSTVTSTSSTTSTTVKGGAPPGPSTTTSTTSTTATPAKPCRITLDTNLVGAGRHGIDNGEVVLTLLTGVFVGIIGAALIGGLRRRTS